ncbi:zinc finger MYM-type protein 2 isoform X2 [Engraulis encrasicolus]|uniref:zinc finger MYM-type protein 2 isoform X2 n=1 Tax=Engraulis encrasicolus TaxID=184585 RepID=UPI002FD53B20
MDGDCELGGSPGVVAEGDSSGAPAAQEDEPMETTASSPAQDDTPAADAATGDVTNDNDTATMEASNSDNGTGSTTETAVAATGVGVDPKATAPPRSSTEDDDVVLVEEERNPALSGDKDSGGGGVAAATKASTDCTEPVGTATADSTTAAANATTASSSSSSSSSTNASPAAASDADATASSVASAPGAKPPSEPIVIDDEEEAEHRGAGSSSSSSSSSRQPATLASTEPDSEIKIASVTTLGGAESSSSSSSASVSEGASAVAAATASVVSPLAPSAQGDMNLMITSVTSLQGGGGEGGLATAAAGVAGSSSEQQEEIGAAAENGLQISSTFSLNPEAQQNQSQSRPSPTFNPGRVGTTAASQPVQNGETGTHQRPDSWISQSASFPRNQKQPGVDSPSPAASLAKPPGQSGQSGSQQPPRTVKVTCANCKKPLKKGQTAYQRKGSSHLFCSTPCLSAFSHKPQPKKHCTMCKKDITSMKGTIVAQVDSSESFQEFCSTGCLAAYENKQATPKSTIKTKCTVCGKLTEIRHEVSFKNVTHKICSDACFNRYRMANGLVMNCCEQCGNYLPSRATAHHYLQVEGQQKRFCSPGCIRDYKQAHGKMTACTGCKVLCRSFDVTQCIGPTGAMEPYCSTACMNKTKAASIQQSVEPSCHFCKRNALPQYQATMPEGKVLNFCSSHCVTKFQSAAVQTSTNGQTAVSAPNANIQLKCNYCRGAFSLKPETLEWENKVYQFCSKTCCEDYKKLHCIVAFCENCHEEKTLHETAKISGVSRPFCGEGCKLLFKQSFARRLGLKCVTCNHCEQMCKRSVTRQMDGVTRDFCSEPCAKKFHDWYYKAARCDCCKVQGNLTESVQWRAEMKRFCDQQCLLRFYLQQNEPNMNTQKGPENTALGIGVQTQGTKVTLFNQAPVSYAGGGILKDVKNKAVLCKPLTMTKATYCKPHMQSKQLQTDEAGTDLLVKKEYVPVPIPVPVYVPVPMNLYAQATPAPVTLPVPVPVPVFLPTTLQNVDQIVAAIKELKAKLPPDILATLDTKPDLIEVKSEEDSLGAGPQVKRERVKSESSSGGDSSSSSSSSDEEEEDKKKDEEEEEEEDKYEADLDLENDFPLASEPVPVVEGLDAELSFTLPPVLAEERDETSRPRPKQKGAKRQAVGGEGSSAPGSPGVGDSDSDPLQPRYGLNAWRRWASSTKQEADALTDTPDTANSKRGLRVKTNLLSMKAGRLGQALSRFVREVRRPNGERYTPDSILYLCLGIQKHLQEKGRTDDLFSDACYSQFGAELNKILKDWQPSVLPDGSLWGRVQERCLWDSGHLGESSPVRLLRSLVYLNTKYFGLRTVEQHLRLSFANVYGPSSTDPVTNKPSIRIRIPSIQQDDNQVQPGRKRKRQQNDLDPDDGSGGSDRCPVKKHECQLYEAYLSKCPVSVRKRADMFYMQPEASGVAGSDASLWFGSAPLDRVTLETLLTRVLLVREIYVENHPDEEEEEEEEEENGGDAMEEEAQKDPGSGRG